MSAPDVLLDQARSQLGRQEAALDTLRTQATAVFSASMVVAALFGPKVLAAAHRSTWGYAAVVLVALGAAATVFVLAPRNMVFTELLDNWWPWLEENEEAIDRDEALTVGLAKNLNQHWTKNRDCIDGLATGYSVSCALLALQVVAWVLAARLV